MGEILSKGLTGGDRSRRAMSSATAVVVLVITIVVLGAISFVVFNTSTTPTCAPASSPVCTKVTNLHDVSILAPFKSAQQDQLIPFTAILSAGETATQFKFNFGDNTPVVTSATPTASHSYAFPGTYLVYVQALVSGTWHDNLHALQGIAITASHVRDTLGTQPAILGVIDSNTTATASPTVVPTGVLALGQSLTVTGRYTANSSNPLYSLITPSLSVSPGGKLGTVTTVGAGNNESLTATATFATAGIYTINFTAGTSLAGVTYYQNYTWTTYVSSPSGVAIVQKPVSDPHPGTVIAYEYAPGGAEGEDPAVDYETVGYEVIVNVYQKLIDYNGTKAVDSPSGYIPVIASCVPGAAQCGQQFASEPGTCAGVAEANLVCGYNYTFVIGSSSHFYDPATGTSWGVWPSDVLFSIGRAIAMASDGEATPGWVQGQSLLPFGNALWDSGLHAPYNSTPQQIFSHILVNDSAFCPTAAMTGSYHGCVTFVVDGSGTTPGAKTWPFFLELMSAIGSSIVPAGWFSAQGSYLPGWTNMTGAYAGDHPVMLPGDATNSEAASFQSAVAAMSVPYWDYMIMHQEQNEWGNVQYHMVGSGPYYVSGYTIGTSYTLEANPAYAQNPSCTTTYVGQTNYCYPVASDYPKQIDVTWEVDPTPGEAALASGVADIAGIPTTQTALTLQLIQQGKAAAISFPSISIFFFAYDLYFGVSQASAYPTGPITAPPDFFTSIGMRNFFSTAYPYATSESTINTVGGIQYGFNYGGVIPQGMGNYYPTNISWPSTDPTKNVNDPASPAYWWYQTTENTTGPYYDAEIAKDCTAATPCQLPFFGQTGAPNYDQALALESAEVTSFSGGAIIVHTLDINFVQLVINSLYSPPEQNPMPIYTLGWAPDYPDPTDYTGAMYYPNATYTYSNDYNQLTENPATNSSSCGFDKIGSYNWSALLYWAGASTQVTQDCQAPAYNAMAFGMYHAAADLNLVNRALVYNEVEHIAQKLALYIYFEQTNQVYTYAPWVNGLSIDEHVTLGGGGDTMWFWLNGNGMVPST